MIRKRLICLIKAFIVHLWFCTGSLRAVGTGGVTEVSYLCRGMTDTGLRARIHWQNRRQFLVEQNCKASRLTCVSGVEGATGLLVKMHRRSKEEGQAENSPEDISTRTSNRTTPQVQRGKVQKELFVGTHGLQRERA